MRLGKLAQVNFGVQDLNASLVFYSKLGFQLLESSNNPYPWGRITDGQNLFLLNQDGNRFISLVYYSRDADRRISKLDKRGIKFVQRRELDGQLKMAVFIGPGGLVVGLIKNDPSGIQRPMGKAITRCGTFGEFAIAVADFRHAVEYWRKLGFTSLFESKDPYPWGIVSDEHIILGLHQNKDYDDSLNFTDPALTYFAPDMANRLDGLRQDDIIFEKELTSEEGVVNNATLRGLDGELLFLFEGEI